MSVLGFAGRSRRAATRLSRADDAAVANAGFFLFVPAAFGDGVAGQVKDRIDAGESGRGRQAGAGLPVERGDLEFFELLDGFGGAAAEDDGLMELGQEAPADKAGGAGNEGFHAGRFTCFAGRISLPACLVSRRA